VVDLTETGAVLVDGSPVGKSDRLTTGSRLEVTLPDPPRPAAAAAEPVVNLQVLHDDADLVVVDKPVGVAAHPSPGWTGPTVLGALAAAGIQVATSGAAERQGVVHRLDVGTSGLMIVAKSERGYSALSPSITGRWCRATRTPPEAPSMPRSTGTPSTTGASPWWPAGSRR
jgi:23S rRNA pseudouridine1911/1915/1917 synthase